MSYQEELSAKLDAVRQLQKQERNVVDTSIQEQKVLDALTGEFEFAQYDLEEGDIFRTLKIINILQSYQEVFQHKSALKLFYVLCRVDVITAKNLHRYLKLPLHEFKSIINAMAKNGLVRVNAYKELELTLDGQSLASRIGIDLFL